MNKASKGRTQIKARSRSKEEADFLISVWDKFVEKYPNNESCWQDFTARISEKSILACRTCASADIEISAADRTAKCNKCKRTFSLSTGTFFERVRNVWAWYAAIWFLQHGAVLNACFLAAIVGLANSSSLHIQKSILAAIAETRTTEVDRVSSLHFDGLFTRRSLATPPWLEASHEEELEQHLEREGNDSKSGQDAASEQVRNEYQDVEFYETTDSNGAENFANASSLLASKETDTTGSSLETLLSEDERLVFELIQSGLETIDAIQAKSGLDCAQIVAAVSILQLENLVRTETGARLFATRAAQTNTTEDSKNKSNTEWSPLCAISAGSRLCLNNECFGTKLAVTDTISTENISNRIRALTAFVSDTVGGISRKYLNFYLSVAQSLSHGDSKAVSISVMDSCLERGYVGAKHIRQSRTAVTVSVPKSLKIFPGIQGSDPLHC